MRLLPDWIAAFMEQTAHLPSPDIFRKWAAISAVAGVLERKVWVRSLNMDLYPNLYIALVGPPGVGKTIVTSFTEELWRSLSGLHVAPKSVSKASLIDSLNDAKRSKTLIGEKSMYLTYNSLLVNAGELAVFIPTYESDFMNILTDIYDGRVYEERRRGKDLHIKIEKPQLNLLMATTPSYLNSMLPEGAWDQGFLSRTFLIFSGQTSLVDLFADEQMHEEQTSLLRSDLRAISDMIGPFGFSDDARSAIRAWHLAGGPPRPDHPKLTHYNTRRSAHLLKLCMVASASRSDDRKIELEDYQRALDWLLEAESIMPEIFKALGAKGDGQTIEEAVHFVYKLYMSTKEPVAEHRLINYISERVPAYNVLRIIEMMERSHKIEKAISSKGMPGWRPRIIQPD